MHIVQPVELLELAYLWPVGAAGPVGCSKSGEASITSEYAYVSLVGTRDRASKIGGA